MRHRLIIKTIVLVGRAHVSAIMFHTHMPQRALPTARAVSLVNISKLCVDIEDISNVSEIDVK